MNNSTTSLDETYGLTLDREDLGFSAAHFMTSDGVLEELSGHSYQLSVEIIGALSSEGFIIDFRVLKPILKDIISIFNHKTIIPTRSDFIVVDRQEENVHIHYNEEFFSIPEAHCVLLDVPNISTEVLSGVMLRMLLDTLPPKITTALEKVRFAISESPGQTAFVEVKVNG